jgi:metal-sulfur cluster biosynthetic enzyme
VQAHELDQGDDLRLGPTEPQRAPADPQAAGNHRQVEHQRGIREHEFAEVDDDIRFGPDRADERLASRPLCGPVLIPTAPEHRRLVIEVDDRANLANRQVSWQDLQGVSLHFPCMVTVDDVNEALRDVIDPELGLDFVELGLIYEIEVDDDGIVRVTYTLTSPGCPIGPQVAEQIEEFVGDLDGVRDVQPTMTFTPPWTPELMSEDAKFALGF